MVRAYVRDKGFIDGEPGDDLAAVIVSCVARQMANPEHQVMVTIDDATIRHGVFNGWTLPELAILRQEAVSVASVQVREPPPSVHGQLVRAAPVSASR